MSDTPPSYPAIMFIRNSGGLLAALLGLAPVIVAIWAVAAGYSWVWFVPAIAVGALLFLVFRSYVEVLRILADTLMPR